MSTSHNTLSLLEARGMEHRAILQSLETNFPPLNPSPSDSISDIMYRAGQRSVVEWILTQLTTND